MSLNKSMVELSTSVSRLNRLINDVTQRLIESEGITDLQTSAGVILLPLLDREGQTLSELARNIHMKAPTITVIANRLEKRGLIRRERGSVDRRQVHLFLSKDGKRIALMLRDIQTKVAQLMAQGIKKGDLNGTMELLDHISQNVSSRIS